MDKSKIYVGEGKVDHQELHKVVGHNGLVSPFGIQGMLGDMEWLGRYNVAPTNFREVEEAEFAQMHMDGYMVMTEERQLLEYHDGTKIPSRIHCTLFIHSGNCGYAIERDYWKKKVRYYRFDKCIHNWVHTEVLGRCYNRYTCSKCGEKQSIDSGD
jgi:hypothetical protein